MSTQFTARYKAMIGPKHTNQLLASAGLGVTGVFYPTQYEISWKPGELVDEERAKRLEPILQRGLDAEDDVSCSSVTLIGVYSSDVEDSLENGK